MPGSGSSAPARRGDLTILFWRSSAAVPAAEVTVGEVAKVTRAGRVALYWPAGPLGPPDWPGRKLPPDGFTRTAVLSQDEIDVPGAMATAACHTADGDATMTTPYDTLSDLNAALRPHLKTSPGWEELHRAAGARAEQVSAAWRAWQSGQRTAAPDPALRRELSGRVAAANQAYRSAYQQVTAAQAGPAAGRAGGGRALLTLAAGGAECRPLGLCEVALIAAERKLGLPVPDITDPAQRARWRQGHARILSRGSDAVYAYARDLAARDARAPAPGLDAGS